jgi:class 3 adenylate cyclase
VQPILLRFAAFCLLALCAFAACADNSTFVITPETRPRGIELEPSQRVYEDASGTLTLENVRALGDEKFVAANTVGKLHLSSAYWTRVTIKSELPTDMLYALITNWWDYQDIYVLKADGSATSSSAGLLREPQDSTENFQPTFLIRAGETLTLYVRLKSTGTFHTPDSAALVISQAASMFEKRLPYFYLQGTVFGMLLALSLYNMFVARSTRDRAYLLYSLYLLAMSLSLIGLMSPNPSVLNLIFLRHYPWAAMWVKRLADPLLWILLLFFDRAFLETRQYLRAWDKVLVVMIVLVTIQELIFFIGLQPQEGVWSWVLGFPETLAPILGVVVGILRYRQGFVPARYFVIAQSLLALGTLVLGAEGEAWNPLTYLPQGLFWRYVQGNSLWVGAAAEAIIFSMGLAYRINILRATVANNALEAERERRRVAIETKERLEVEVAERTQDLRVEKEKTSLLLHNILPVEIANELIANGSTQPQRHEEVSILFTDFKEFTSAVASLPAKLVVEELNDMFQHFDDIIDACGIEKIKTIGDSYMIVGGLPNPVPDHAERCVEAALRMLAYLDDRNETSALKWRMRAGIHSGAVIAGVVGKRKFGYDVWGDTVNVASRMESAGEAGRVNVSAYTYNLIKCRYRGEYRGNLAAKGKGEIEMYFVIPEAKSVLTSG